MFVLEAKHPAYAAEPTLSDSVPGVLGAPGDSGVPHLFVLEYCSGTGKTGRHFGKILSGLLCLAGYIMQPFTEKKQALHDIMAGTLVVKA